MKNTTLSLLILLSSVLLFAQDNQQLDYKRSSLALMMIEDGGMLRADLLNKSYSKYPFPDKYNDHNLNLKSYDILSLEVIKEEKEGTKGGALKGALKGAVEDANLDNPLKDIDLKIDKFLSDEKIANQMVAKWWDRKDDGSFGIELVGTRGCYNADAMDLVKADMRSESATGIFIDAGNTLIPNTFLVLNKFKFVDNEIAASVIYKAAEIAAGQIENPMAQEAAKKTAKKVYEATREGYSVWTISYLYQLDWNDSIQTIFFTDYWVNETDAPEVKAERSALFDNSNLFKMNYLGTNRAMVLVMDLKGGLAESVGIEGVKKSLEQQIEEGVVRSMNKVFSKLQKKYEDFQVVTPIYSADKKMATAKIGMKEGLEGGESFTAYEQVIDKKTGVAKLKSVATIKVDKKAPVWDNRFNIVEQPESETPWTTFKAKGLYAGMLIKQNK